MYRPLFHVTILTNSIQAEETLFSGRYCALSYFRKRPAYAGAMPAGAPPIPSEPGSWRSLCSCSRNRANRAFSTRFSHVFFLCRLTESLRPEVKFLPHQSQSVGMPASRNAWTRMWRLLAVSLQKVTPTHSGRGQGS